MTDTSTLPAEALPLEARPGIEVTGDASTIREITKAIESGSILPDVYVTGGALMHLSKVSGDSAPIGAETPPHPVAADPITPASLAALLAHNAYVFQLRTDAKGNVEREEVAPAPRIGSAILSQRYWPNVRPLYGIVGSPVLRPDGTLLQTAGYDSATGLYYAPKVRIPAIASKPSSAAVRAAKAFLDEELLKDFPFVGDADRANYIGLLVSEILRPYLRSLTPFGLISATTQSSGKTLLAEIPGYLYGQKNLIWRKGDDAELEKSITAALRSPAPVMLWDNIAEGSVMSAAVLAQLITGPVWSGRVLGSSTTWETPNNRLWLATGNNIRLGGDMSTRTVLIRLDPNDPHPDRRDQTEFGIPHLDTWLKSPTNRVIVLGHLLTLVMDWMAHGAPRANHNMRQFTTWAAATGGFLQHHGFPEFLGNVDQVREADEEDAEWVGFLSKMYALNKPTDPERPIKKSARDIRLSADIEADGRGQVIDRWQGTFLTDDNGKLPTAKSLGKLLTGHIGRWHGDYVLRSEVSASTNARAYWVEAKK